MLRKLPWYPALIQTAAVWWFVELVARVRALVVHGAHW